MERANPNLILLSTHNYCESIKQYNSIFDNFRICNNYIFEQKFYMPK